MNDRDLLKQALENCRLLAAKHRNEEWAKHILRFCEEAGVRPTALRDRLAQPLKPCQTGAQCVSNKCPQCEVPQQDGECPHCDGSGCVACDARHLPEQEPVAWKDRIYGNLHHQDFGNSIPLYTAPPRREWVGLTDVERIDLCVISEAVSAHSLIGMVEAKLKEKNA